MQARAYASIRVVKPMLVFTPLNRALGMDAVGKDVAHWESLRQFWGPYFNTAGTNLRSYAVLRTDQTL